MRQRGQIGGDHAGPRLDLDAEQKRLAVVRAKGRQLAFPFLHPKREFWVGNPTVPLVNEGRGRTKTPELAEKGHYARA